MDDPYSVKTTRAPKWAPPLYLAFAKWLTKQTRNSLGYFEPEAAAATARKDWSPAAVKRVKAEAFSFARLPDGSELWLIKAEAGAPNPVVHNGSETEIEVMADSFEAFLFALAKGGTDIADLDDVDAEHVERAEVRERRKGLRDWLKTKAVKPPKKAPRFDLEAWLGNPAAKPKGPDPVLAPERFAGDAAALAPLRLEPVMAELVSMLGRRADDPVLIRFMEKRVGKKCPPTLGDSKWITWSKVKVDLLFDGEAENAKYPSLSRGRSMVPYLTTLNFDPAKTRFPFGITRHSPKEELVAKLGKPSLKARREIWHVPLIRERDVVLSHYGPKYHFIYLRIKKDDEKLSQPPR